MGGSRARQMATLASGNIPHHGHRARFRSVGWPGGRNLLFSRVSIISSFFGSSSFSVSLASSVKPIKSVSCGKPAVPRSCLGTGYATGHQAVRKLYCVQLVLHIIITISLTLVVLLNCLYFNPRASLVFCSPPHPAGGVSERLSSAELLGKPLQWSVCSYKQLEWSTGSSRRECRL